MSEETALEEKAETEFQTSWSLEEMAEKINEQHELCAGGWRTTLDHAITAGALLKDVKLTLDHGEFGKWIKDNCGGFGIRTAQVYMRLYEERVQVRSSNAQPTAHLTMSKAIKFLLPKQEPVTAEPVQELNPVEQQEETTAPVAEVQEAEQLTEEEAPPWRDPEEATEAEPVSPDEEQPTDAESEEQEPNIERRAVDLIAHFREIFNEALIQELDQFIQNQPDLPWQIRKDMKEALEPVMESAKKIWLNRSNKLAREQEVKA